ncbi:thioredoxin [Geitlerinema sp. PCC 7407]|uniref:thioredoxin n=1 Tax=Geitlerinema sp. PCC 7407 TaxID=1173025 RepID=UPI00029FD32F|nr:thioredoxin [Geitlerinema sp. PCC 7407]AFY68100.1 thioredoxin [Geitlerinema sp. PCC 7407]
MSSGVLSINDAQFEAEVLQATQPVLVDFWAEWCGPCRLIAPLMDYVANTYGDRLKVIKMEVDPNPETVAQYKVQGIPTLILFQGGEVKESIEGAIGKQRLEDWLLKNLPELQQA